MTTIMIIFNSGVLTDCSLNSGVLTDYSLNSGVLTDRSLNSVVLTLDLWNGNLGSNPIPPIQEVYIYNVLYIRFMVKSIARRDWGKGTRN